MTFFTGIPSYEVAKAWPSVKRFIESGLVEGDDIEKIFSKILTRQCTLWSVSTEERPIAAAVTEVVILDGKKVCNVISIGGTRMSEWIANITIIEAWAYSNGCSAMRFADCRPGWSRILAQHGYQTKFVVLEKALTNGQHH